MILLNLAQVNVLLLIFHQAGNDFMRSSFGAGFPLFATAMYNKLGVGWASSLLGFLAIAFIPIPFILYKVCDLVFQDSQLSKNQLVWRDPSKNKESACPQGYLI